MLVNVLRAVYLTGELEMERIIEELAEGERARLIREVGSRVEDHRKGV